MNSALISKEPDPNTAAKKKRCRLISIGAVVVLAIITIILMVALNKKDDDPPKPPAPIPPGAGVNPYYFLNDSHFDEGLSMIKGHLKANTTQLELMRS